MESGGVLRSALSGAVRGASPETLARWSSWTVSLDVFEEGGFARAIAHRILTRGSAVSVAPRVEAGMIARFGRRAALAAAAHHRIQLAALSACRAGAPDVLETDLARGGVFAPVEAAWIAESARLDLADLMRDLRALYPDDARPDAPVFVSFTAVLKPGWNNVFVVESGDFGAELTPPAFNAEPLPFIRDDSALERLAARLFSAPSLRPGQADAVAALLSGRDVAAALPTGAGKSLIYQLASLLTLGTAVVVAPLRALIRDGARRLRAHGVDRIAVLCGDDPDETRAGLKKMEEGRLILALTAPERLDSPSFRRSLRAAAEGDGISFVVIDEAHCAARRGHDWRPAYRAFGARIRDWSARPGREIPVAALSGTASPVVWAETTRVLRLNDALKISASPERSNLNFESRIRRHGEILPILRGMLCGDGAQTGPGIIFCQRVEGPSGAVTLARELSAAGVAVAAYAGRVPTGEDEHAWDGQKRAAADDFLSGRIPWICATRAFGLGIDRLDVRRTIHVGFPASLEEFFQQTGRAGRDGALAHCCLLAHVASPKLLKRWAALPLEDLRAEIFSLRDNVGDDAARAYFLHLAAHPGIKRELADAELILRELSVGEFVSVARGRDESAVTRALARLEDAGVVELNAREARGWRVRKLMARIFEDGFAAARRALERDYATIEPARRASLAELIEISLLKDSEREFARRLASSAGIERSSTRPRPSAFLQCA